MLLRLLSLFAALALVAFQPAQAKDATAGIWVFDTSLSYPGVQMMELTQRNRKLSGILTTRWYGAMEMQNIERRGDTIAFDMRNLNDKANPTRRWTATVSDGRVTLTGDIWYAHVEQTGRRGTKGEAKARRFKPVQLPPLAPVAADGLAATPPMGWSSWNKFAERIDDKTVREIADAMVSSGLRDAGYVYVNIDDGWQGTRGPDGAIRPNEKFPDMKALADYVHARGLKIGIYSSPGPMTCAGYIGSYGHVEQDARTFAEWGMDYLKYDLCSGEWFYSSRDEVQRAYQQMGAALKATGRDIVYSLCQYGRVEVSEWGRDVGGHLWRTTGDITDDFAKMSDIGFDRNPKFGNAGPGGWNDPDMLEVGNGGMTETEYRTHMTLWAMSAAPLLMGHDLRTMDEATRAILSRREVIAVDQDVKGAQGRVVSKDGDAEIWAKPLSDGSVAVALFNRGTTGRSISVAPGDAGFRSLLGGRDLWRGTDVDTNMLDFAVPAHGSVMLRLSGRH
ncbi:glycoside hydrolase family 27 protein [Sphingomonas cavernae]|uniref:Alpha-galactosidase n=1 Tax=Sphingomonas cavernae TaxID=2320861 RepID=A0A418W7A3_9SPHN|nr:glycoside hydrolase family 27 protein [Sphingomonas cavernae]RJF85848.1 glycoside hydrolase family 27 protein [Sphingomonas cavernae]